MFFNRKVIIFKVRMWSLNREGSKSKIFCTQSEMCFAFSCEKGIFDHLLGIGPLNNFPLAFQRGVSSDILSLFCLGVSSKASDTLNWWPSSSLDPLFFPTFEKLKRGFLLLLIEVCILVFFVCIKRYGEVVFHCGSNITQVFNIPEQWWWPLWLHLRHYTGFEIFRIT